MTRRLPFSSVGGTRGLATIVRIDREAGHPNVFGVIDRDYGSTNRSKWDQPTTRLFRLRDHEVENSMLVAPALASSRWNNRRLAADVVETMLVEAARRRSWYEACRAVLDTLRGRFRCEFIADPPQDLPDLTAAQRHLCESSWFLALAKNAARTTEVEIVNLLAVAHEQAIAQLDDGTWRGEFSGKELFKDVASRICDRQKLGGIRSSELHADLARDVAEWQRDCDLIPDDLVALRITLQTHIGSMG